MSKNRLGGIRSQYDLLPDPAGVLRHRENPVLSSRLVGSLMSFLALGFPQSFKGEVSIISLRVGVLF